MGSKVRVILDCDLITNHNVLGYAIVRHDGGYGVIDEYGKLRIPFEKHQNIEPTEKNDVFIRSYYGAPGFRYTIK